MKFPKRDRFSKQRYFSPVRMRKRKEGLHATLGCSAFGQVFLWISLNFIRLLRVIITPSVAERRKTTRSNRMKFRPPLDLSAHTLHHVAKLSFLNLEDNRTKIDGEFLPHLPPNQNYKLNEFHQINPLTCLFKKKDTSHIAIGSIYGVYSLQPAWKELSFWFQAYEQLPLQKDASFVVFYFVHFFC